MFNKARRPYDGLPTASVLLYSDLEPSPSKVTANENKVLGLIRKTSLALSLLIIFGFQFGLLGVLLRLHTSLAFVKSELSFALE